MLKLHILCVYQVLDHAERLRDMEPTLLPAMLRLAELVSQKLLLKIDNIINSLIFSVHGMCAL